MEIERKFLVARLPGYLDAGEWATLRQGYLAAGEGSDVRVRESDGVFTLTAKSGSGLVREEHEVLITDVQFEALWPATFGRRIEKRRCTIPVGDLRYEVDVFEGDLAGLMVAEVEFDSVEQATAFAPPAWFGIEVTGDARYSNALLAKCGLPPAGAESL